VTKCRKVRWAGHIAWIGDMRNTIFWFENLKGRDHLEDTDIDRNIILEWISAKLGGRVWTGCM